MPVRPTKEGEMPEDQPAGDPQETPKDDPQRASDGLMADLAKERKERQANEKRAADLEARLKEYEDSQKSELEKATSRATEATEKVNGLTSENLRLRTALAKSLPLELADRLRGDSAEEMAADADRLLALVAPQRVMVPNGGFDPGARDTAPNGSEDMTAQIRRQLGRA